MSGPYDPRLHYAGQLQYGYQPGAYAPAPNQDYQDPRTTPHHLAARGQPFSSQTGFMQRLNTSNRHDEELFMPRPLDGNPQSPAMGQQLPPPPPAPPAAPSGPYSASSSSSQQSPSAVQQHYHQQRTGGQATSYNPQLYNAHPQAGSAYQPVSAGSQLQHFPAGLSPAINGSPSSVQSFSSYRNPAAYSPFLPMSATPISQQSMSPHMGFQPPSNVETGSYQLYPQYPIRPAGTSPPISAHPSGQGLSIQHLPGPPPLPPAHASGLRPTGSILNHTGSLHGPSGSYAPGLQQAQSYAQPQQGSNTHTVLPDYTTDPTFTANQVHRMPSDSSASPQLTMSQGPHSTLSRVPTNQSIQRQRPEDGQTQSQAYSAAPPSSSVAMGFQAGPYDYPVPHTSPSTTDPDQIWKDMGAMILAAPSDQGPNSSVSAVSNRQSHSSPVKQRAAEPKFDRRSMINESHRSSFGQDVNGSGVVNGRTDVGDASRPSPVSRRSENHQHVTRMDSSRAEPPRYGNEQSPIRNDMQEASDDDDYAGVGVDMGFYGGDYNGGMAYGGGHVQATDRLPKDSLLEDPSSSTQAQDALDDKYIHPFPDLGPSPPPIMNRLQTSGSVVRKLSFEAGDEAPLGRNMESSTVHSPSTHLDDTDIPDLAFYPPTAIGAKQPRPLPALPPNGDAGHRPQRASTAGPKTRISGVPLDPDVFAAQPGQEAGQVPRATSVLSHGNQPYADLPIRAKTDADEKKPMVRRQPDSRKISESTFSIDLPVIPPKSRVGFSVQKLSSEDFYRCQEPWALSGVASWVKQLTTGVSDLKEKDVFDTLVALFTHKVITMNIADAEVLARQVLDNLLSSGSLQKEEEWVRHGEGSPCSVIVQLAGLGCYSSLLHERPSKIRCYSQTCARTVKKVDLTTHSGESTRGLQDWASFWNLQKTDVEGKAKKEIERQNVLHEIIQTEYEYIDQLNVVRVVYRDGLRNAQPPILKPSRLPSFEQNVFGSIEDIERINAGYLLAHLKYRQQEQGPWVFGYSDLFREWIRRAKDVYISYSSNFPAASTRVRDEATKNVLFSQFLENARNDPRSRKLGWDSYLKSPITRLQRYSLLLGTVLKNTEEGTREREMLSLAIAEIKEVTLKCDSMVAEQKKKVDMQELSLKLILRPGMEQDIQLELSQNGRELIKRGDLQRLGGTKLTWLDIHAILFDHFLILAKRVVERTVPGGPKLERYDVSKKPISMDLLVLEGVEEDAVTKPSVRGLGPSTVPSRPGLPTSDSMHARTNSFAGSVSSPSLYTVNSNASVSTLNSLTPVNSARPAVTNLAAESGRDDKLLFPFRIRHLGQEVYTLFAPSATARQEWCDAISQAKARHASGLYAAHVEPFRLKILADSAFAYDALVSYGSSRAVTTAGTPLERSIRDVEAMFTDQPRPAAICRQTVNCATTFVQPDGLSVHAVGTDFGVFFCDIANPRGWYKAIAANRVAQLMVLEEFSLILVLADKALVAHHLDTVCQTGTNSNVSTVKRQAAQQISDHRDVAFFAVGRMKDRMLVFYKRRSAQNSVFKILEPVLDRGGDRQRNRWGSRTRGSTEFFREYGGGFYIPTECYGLNLFTSSIAVGTARGFEMLTLDTTEKPPISVPDLSQSNVASIAARLSHQKPVSMLRLSKLEFILVYETCALYIDKHGEISRQLVIEFEGKAKSACLWPPHLGTEASSIATHGDSMTASTRYLILFDADFVEVRDAENGRLRQVIPGKDVRMLDDGRGKGEGGTGSQIVQNGHGPGEASPLRSIKFALGHPERDGSVLVLEMVMDNVGKY